MSRLLRFTLTWLLALALPIQGYAAQANLVRNVAHQASMSLQHAGMAMHSHQSHAHAQHLTAVAQQDADCCDEGDLKASTHGASTHSKCSSCASSCGAVAITTPIVSINVAAYASTLVATVDLTGHHFLTGGIDRPPRPAFA